MIDRRQVRDAQRGYGRSILFDRGRPVFGRPVCPTRGRGRCHGRDYVMCLQCRRQGYGRGYGQGYGQGYGHGYGQGYGRGFGQGYGQGFGLGYDQWR